MQYWPGGGEGEKKKKMLNQGMFNCVMNVNSMIQD